ncbi:conjugal transfer protein TrbL family protein [Micromonospora sp. WMMA1923]|uniref:conjugal transfer protein TrbL family protein n=1 Tax=Micromonospora sp. WMMA1923 TaxID=3404125 RepID=UPI003B94E48B
MTIWLMDGLVIWLAEKVVDLLGGLLAFLTTSLFVSPDVTVLPQVQSIAGRSSVVVNACFVLAIIAVGVALMLGDSVGTQYQLKQLLPRLVVGFVLSAFAVPLTSLLIGVANTLTTTMAGTSAPTTETLTFVRRRVTSALIDESAALLVAVIGLIIVVLMFMLVGSWLARIGLLVVLAGIAPVALACYATPWTQGAADLWWRTLLGCLATPALQAVAFSAGINLIVGPDTNLPILLGLPGSDTLNLLLVIVVLWTTIRIPSLMRRFAAPLGRGSGITSLILRIAPLPRLPRSGGRLRPGRRDI